MKDWILQYDSALDQYYYLNTKDNTISFDSPCEVNKKSKRFFGLAPNCRRTKSASSVTSISSTGSTGSFLSKLSFKKRKNDSKSEVLDDEYLFGNPANFKNFAGTSLTPENYDDMSSMESDDSIVTYYSNLNSHDYQYSEASSENVHTFNKEKERMELRLQFLKELEV